MTNHGRKTKAGKLLTRYLEIIATEETECILGDDGEDRMATKAEALCRTIWKRALGYTETDAETGTSIIFPPDRGSANILFERLEGRVPTAGADESGKLTAAQRVS